MQGKLLLLCVSVLLIWVLLLVPWVNDRPNTTHGYDSLGRRTSTQTGPLHTTFEYASNSGSSVFDVSGFKPTKSTGPRGVVTTVQYDDLYRAVSTTVSDGGTTTTEYDAVGRPVEVTDALGRSTMTTYDALGQAIRVDLPDGTEVETKYTQLGKPWWVKDGLGRITETEYDSAGRAISVTNPLGQTVHSEYDAAGNAIKVTDARGHITESSYDSRNRPIEVKAPLVVNGETGQSERPITSTTYDAAGKPLSVTDPLGHVTINTYDQASRVVKVKNALNQETLTTYDASGNVLTVTDANGKVTTNEYDSLGRLSLTTDAEGVLTEFDYDLSGNRTMVKDGKGNVTTFDYDLQNRVTEEHYANGDETTYTYNALQKLTRTDAAGTTSYTYDERDRLLTVDFVTGPDRTYAYDDAGQLLSVTESGHAAANVSYTYDLAGKVLSETSRGKTHTYTYDAAGNRTGTTYSTGRSETRTYDALNRIATLVEGGRTTTWHYDLAGRAIALTLGNGQQQDNHYDAVGKLTARHLFNPNQTLIATFQWQHDAVGNVTQQTERWLGDATRNNALRTTTMAYDDVYRLTGETVTQSGEITRETLYTYDDASNRASKVEKENTVVVKDTSYTYNTANQLIAWSEENGTEVVQRSAAMTYDTRGNRASTVITTHGEVPGTETTTYTWTPQNMLASVTLPDSSVHSYAYDYRVRRITRTEGNANPVAMTFSGGLSVAEFEVLDSQLNTLDSQPSVEYQRGPDMGGGVGGLLYSLRSGTAKFNLSNGRGDVVAQSDATGDLTWTASYEAYGKRPVETGSNADRQRANTKEEDPTGLLNEGFRYRDLETDVWLSKDPAGFVDGPNLYAYVKQNPWSKFDPLGLYEEGEDGTRIHVQKDGYIKITGAPGGRLDSKSRELIFNQFVNHDVPEHIAKAEDAYVREWNPVQGNHYIRMQTEPKYRMMIEAWAASAPGALSQDRGFLTSRLPGRTATPQSLPIKQLGWRTSPKLFKNLGQQQDPAQSAKLTFADGKYKLQMANGQTRTATGQMNFVTMPDGRILVSSTAGHTGISQGRDVAYAGQVTFTKKGALKEWDNGSGHYMPSADYAKQAGLPMDKFTPHKDVLNAQD
ncbi:RHS repeat-associated protein [Roseimicrobium gellanilyticum]|uniref:RHS repeat-associated protein n=1 Tax=Roseimicrobium gellanilyticum TaxID=748857 RepID=A0A366H0A9_9BACT|nr:RHS repeat-associated core domain-containing protein [Roseimicrobium gellanilyticum]RBP35123.1 RHS repeat-associated protein [Roseimicrobium gellanilyticum]